MEQQIKQAIEEIQNYKDLMDCEQASNKLNELSVLHSSLTSEIAKAQNVFDVKLNEIMDECDSVSLAKVRANATIEHYELDRLVKLEKSLVECIRSLKIWIKIRVNEWNNSFNQ